MERLGRTDARQHLHQQLVIAVVETVVPTGTLEGCLESYQAHLVVDTVQKEPVLESKRGK